MNHNKQLGLPVGNAKSAIKSIFWYGVQDFFLMERLYFIVQRANHVCSSGLSNCSASSA